MELNKIYNQDCLEGMKNMPDGSIDCILTDPPYLYLKGQKLEREFDEQEFFRQCKRVLKKDGMMVLFGRGTSFYRWNTILSNLGFVFKEEIIWDKSYSSSPLLAVSRVHETIGVHRASEFESVADLLDFLAKIEELKSQTVSIHSKGKGSINRSKIPYLEMKGHDVASILQDIKRMRSILKNPSSLQAVEDFLENNLRFTEGRKKESGVTISGGIVNSVDRAAGVMISIQNGYNEKTIIRTDRKEQDSFTKFNVTADKRDKGDRNVDVFQAIEYGLNEKTIIKQVRDHYSAIHPTQKPVRLLERLLALTTKPGDIVADFFWGSGSTGIACMNTERSYIGFEIDIEYYEKSLERINHAKLQKDLTLDLRFEISPGLDHQVQEEGFDRASCGARQPNGFI
jgi:site-specific DNA-methyltransferase (adenine-specific)